MRNRENGSPCQGNGEQAGRGKSSGSAWPGEEEPSNDVTTPSYKKPLYGISHKIMEKKNPPTGDALITCSSSSRRRTPGTAPHHCGS